MKPGITSRTIWISAIALIMLSVANIIFVYTSQYPLLKISLPLALPALFVLLTILQNWQPASSETKQPIGPLEKLNCELEQQLSNNTGESALLQKKLSDSFEQTPNAFVSIDANWCYTFMNKKAAEIFQRDRHEIIGKNVWAEFPGSTESAFYLAYHQAMQTQHYSYLEEYYPPNDRWYKNHIYPSPDGLSIFISDITDQKKAAEKLMKANRLYFFISHINQMIVRTRDEVTLFRDTCNIAINIGKFKMAWIGLLDETNRQLVPVAHAGLLNNNLPDIQIFADQQASDWHTPTALLPQGKYIVCNDVETEAGMELQKKAVLQQNCCSSISFPIKKAGQVVGTFNLYAATKHFFDAEEITLLEEATGDISFSLDVFEKETRRQKAEAAVLESEQRYQTLAEVSPVGIFHTDAAGATTYVNPRWCQIAGITFEETLGSGWQKAIHEDDREVLIRDWNQAKERHDISSSEYRFVKPDGTVVWVIGQATPERDSENRIIGYVGTITDISRRKKAEEAIKKVNDRFEMISLATNDAVFELDLLRKEGWYNDSFLNLFDGGISGGNLRQDITLWISKLHPADREKVTAKMEATYTGVAVTAVDEYRFQKADGTYGIFYARTFVTRNETGKAVRVVGSMTEVTDLKQVEEQLKASEEKYRILFYNNPMPSWVTDKSTSAILDVNDAAVNHYGYQRSDFLTMQTRHILSPEEYKKYASLKQAGGIPAAGNIGVWHHIKKDGTIIKVDVKVHDIIYNDKPCRITLANDVTEQRKAEEEIRKANERFELIAEATNDVIWDWNLLTDQLWWNNKYYSSFGYEDLPTTSYITSWNDRIHPDDSQRVLKSINKAVESGESLWQEEYRYLKNDGTIIFIYDRGFILHDENGRAYRMMGSMLDVTELKKVQEQVINERNLSDSIINSLPGIFYLFDENGKYLRWNKNFEKVGMYSAEEIRQLQPLDFFDGSDKDLIADKIAQTFASEEVNVQATLLAKSGKKTPYYFTGILVDYEGKPCLMGVGIDFSERVAAQEKIQQSSEQLRKLAVHLQTIREEERKRIGREIHDELGQQLTAIKMDIAWIDKKIPEETVALKSKLKNVIHLLDVSNLSIRRILSELRAGILEDHGLLEAIRWLSRQFTSNTGIPVKFTTTETIITTSAPVANCIFRAYQEAFTNITRYASATQVDTSLTILNDTIHLVIEDDGVGFDSTAVQNGKSFGILGMKERVLSLDGKFELTSSPGAGTTIIISLPGDTAKNN